MTKRKTLWRAVFLAGCWVVFGMAWADVRVDRLEGRRTGDGYVVQGRIRPVEGSSFRVRDGSRLLLDFTVNDTDTEAELRKSAMTFYGTFSNSARVDLWGKFKLEQGK